jgi:hypothetical protein
MEVSMNARSAAAFCLMVLLWVASQIAGEGNPNFTGTWNLDREKSELGDGGGRRGGGMLGSITLEHSGDTLIVKRKLNFQGEERLQEARYTTDGRENVNEGFRGTSIKSKTHWQDATLITESSVETPNGTRETKEVRSLSADGKVMNVEITIKGGFGEGTRKLVYTKQE